MFSVVKRTVIGKRGVFLRQKMSEQLSLAAPASFSLSEAGYITFGSLPLLVSASPIQSQKNQSHVRYRQLQAVDLYKTPHTDQNRGSLCKHHFCDGFDQGYI